MQESGKLRGTSVRAAETQDELDKGLEILESLAHGDTLITGFKFVGTDTLLEGVSKANLGENGKGTFPIPLAVVCEANDSLELITMSLFTVVARTKVKSFGFGSSGGRFFRM